MKKIFSLLFLPLLLVACNDSQSKQNPDPTPQPGPTPETTVSDTITYQTIGIDTLSEYKNYNFVGPSSGISFVANATYKQETSGDVSYAIQLKSKNSESGIIVKNNNEYVAKSISVVWSDSTDTKGHGDRFVSIYAKDTPYESVSDLYDESKQGTLLTSLQYPSNASNAFETNCKYIGLCSTDGAIYLKSFTITWSK